MRARPVLALVLLALVSCTASATEASSATVVLFDVSNSTRTPAVRARYDATFGLVLANVREAGGALGADVIDGNPMVHGALPVNVTFEPCTIADNSLDCRQALEEKEAGPAGRRARSRALGPRHGRVRRPHARGPVLRGVPGRGRADPRRPVRHGAVGERDAPRQAGGLVRGAARGAPRAGARIDLAGVRVYVVGAGATTLVGTTPMQIEGIERFWTRWFQAMGATVEFYGANLARFPIEQDRQA